MVSGDLLPSSSYVEIKNNFISHVQAASKSESSSLLYVKHYLPSSPLIARGTVQVAVIGGTYYEFATVSVTTEGTRITERKKGTLPSLANADILRDFFQTHSRRDVDAVSINFAFPLEPTTGDKGELDGKLIRPTKEHLVSGLIGAAVGGFLRKEVFKKDIPVSVANDTVCLSLSGDGSEKAAMVLGSGFNLSLNTVEDNRKIVINLEAGSFNGFPISDVLQNIDDQSGHRGTYLFEKSVAGKYLVSYFNETAKTRDLHVNPVEHSEELSALSANDTGIAGDLARSILAHSASLVAASLAGLYEHLEKPKTMPIITEGSLFWKGWKYKEQVEDMLLELGIPEDTILFKSVEDSSIKGAINLLA